MLANPAGRSARDPAGEPGYATLGGAGRHRARCPCRNALGALRRAQAAAGRGLDSEGRADEGEGGPPSRLGPRRKREGDARKGSGSLAACAPPCGAGRSRCTTARPGPRSTPHGTPGRPTKPETSPVRPPATSAPAEPARESACWNDSRRDGGAGRHGLSLLHQVSGWNGTSSTTPMRRASS